MSTDRHHHHDQPAGTPSAHTHDTLHAAYADHSGPGPHDRHAGHSIAMFRDRFWLSLLLTVPTLVWGHMLQQLFGYAAPVLPGSHHIPALFGTAVFLYGGRPFLQGAARELRERLPGMMTLIALAIGVAFLFSAAVTLGYPGMPLWEELATLVTIMLLGHWIEMRSIAQAQGALRELAKLLPNTATRVRREGAVDKPEELEEIPVAELREGDVMLVRPGASVPADGEVVDGRSSVNEAMVTGESRPVEKTVGTRVIAGTVNGGGSLRVRVTSTGDRTMLAGIMRLVEQAQGSRSRAQALADRAAFWLTIVALAAGSVTLVAWLVAGAGLSYAVERLVAVLVIACPHALGLAIPLVIAISTTIGARSGLLVRDRRGLEEARNLSTIVFDKTGTLTLGEHRVVGILASGMDERQALALAAAVEQDSEHPLARAIVTTARERGIPVPSASEFLAIAGYGVEARVDGKPYAVGGPNLLARRNAVPAPDLQAFVDAAAKDGQGAVYLLDGDRPRAAFALADALRPESREAVDRLHELGLQVAMLTGDAQVVADRVGRELGIDTVLAQVLPDAKAAKIEELQRQGKRVAMVGDGVNDAPALVTADVGIAIGAGTDVAVEAGDVVLVRSDPRDVPRLVALSRASYRKMVQNLWWAAGYNIVAIPLAAGVLAPAGIVLSPAVGAVLMSLSTVIVALNAQLLRRIALTLVAGALVASADASAQVRHEGHDSSARAEPRTASMSRPFGIPMTRMGSGTAWLPDASGMRAWHFSAGSWMLMVHGDAFLQYDHQGGPRGDDQLGSINWGMIMAMRTLAGGTLHLHGMASAEPLTIGARGYPLLLQSGESYRGGPLYDRQHPHDLFMELSALYERPVARDLGVMLYVAPVGEPGIGPVAYMHRPSALNDPFAPLAHHWTDATHITYGVVTAGLFTRTVKLEGTVFNGREPDEDRYDFDFDALDSYGARLSTTPTPHWAVSASYTYLKEPEELEPGEDQRRLSASVLHTIPLGRHGEWASALVYGGNQHLTPDGDDAGGWEHSLIAESNLQLDGANTVFGRVEYVRKSAEDLVIKPAGPAAEFDIVTLSLGYIREFVAFQGATLGLGARGAVNFIPQSLEEAYGSRAPAGLALFVRLRPVLFERAHASDAESHGARSH